ncbi:hypothetical protein SDC9_103703 [bioreactor metagenome]|uniref:DUF192 domain-containing protein n=1 Tax=bioreactor metagenome TaxID=1076179 RepID=A0A645AVR4_9ZZZZ|nr:DUF192 domain-containing protein [Oscillospiraceae bacterium]
MKYSECEVYVGPVILFKNVKIANTFIKRLVGLLKTESLASHGGMLISPCNKIHTLGMQYPIDVLFLSSDGEIIDIISSMQAGKVSPMIKGADHVLELSPGAAASRGLKKGDYLTIPAVKIGTKH